MVKVAVVTGGTRGIGLGIVKMLAINSYIVYAVGTREKEDDYPGFSSFKKHHGNCKYISANIQNADDRRKIVDTVPYEVPVTNITKLAGSNNNCFLT